MRRNRRENEGLYTKGFVYIWLRAVFLQSNAYATLENRQSGGSVYIWFANQDGIVDFYGVTVSLKKGWNFVEGF
jgi:hypothetical protein